jgi:DNA-binding GntR family transcriptional regulator
MTAVQQVRTGGVLGLHRKKADIAYEYLREQIVNGSFVPGQRMTLAQLSAACAMSHMPVREALLRLEREGLLESEPHKGMRVMELSQKDARELFAIRTELEGLAAHDACEAGDAGLVGDLKAINQDFRDALARTDFTAMGAANWAFHQRILRSTGNAQLDRMLKDVWTASQRYRLGYKLIPGRARSTIAEHAKIIAAFKSGDPERARAAARSHIQRAGAELALIVQEAQSAANK